MVSRLSTSNVEENKFRRVIKYVFGFIDKAKQTGAYTHTHTHTHTDTLCMYVCMHTCKYMCIYIISVFWIHVCVGVC